MWNSRPAYLNDRGFTLVELILWLALFSILAASFCSFLNYTNHIVCLGDKEDEVLLNGKYGLEFIKKEISSADKLISSSKIEDLDFYYPSNIGFVILTIRGDDRNEYIYSTYYLKNDELVRIASRQDSSKYPSSNHFSGYNQICTKVVNLSKVKLSVQNKIVNLNLLLECQGIEARNFATSVFIRCPIDE